MTALTSLGEVNPRHRGFQELYQRGDEYIVVSTVGEVAPNDPAAAALVGLVGALSDYATSGEETMAFPADADGQISSWGEIAVANGKGSRQAVLDQLGGVA